MKSVWIILGSLFALIGGSNAQNLVPNGSFEQYEQCPPYPGQIHLANAWDAPNNQTTDFFHRCAPASTGASVPANLVGTQAPKSGDGYAGLRTWVPVIDGNPPYREYLTVALKAPLQAGQAYELQCWASAAEASSHFSDGFGFLFSEAPLPPQAIYTSSPDLRFPSGTLMEQTKEWEPYAAVYLARGGERYLTLGNFRADTAMMRQQANTQPPTVYYYIDNVNLEACALPDQLLSERDTFVCQGEPLLLSGLEGALSYTWEDGRRARERLVEAAGQYTLITDWVCYTTRTVYWVEARDCGCRLRWSNPGIGLELPFDLDQFDLQLYDALGRRVGTFDASNWEQLKQWHPSGLYFWEAVLQCGGRRHRQSGKLLLVE